MQGLSIIDLGRVLPLEPFRLDLKGIGIDLSFPEPVSAAQLDVIRIDLRNPLQGIDKSFPGFAVINTDTDIGDPVFDHA